MIISILSVLEWIVWGVSLLIGLWFGFGIRLTAVRRDAPPVWTTLVTSFALIAFPVIFLFVPFNKFHIIWLLVVTWLLSFLAGFGYIPLISQLFIWPAYLYASMLMVGTGVHLSSPSKQSPWAAHGVPVPLRYLAKALFKQFTHKRSPEEEAHIARIRESRTRMTEPTDSGDKE